MVSGKGSGYYGCYNSKRKRCQNTLLIPRKKIEEKVITELSKNVLTTENLEYVYKKVEKLTAEGLNEVPELLKKKEAQLEKIQQEVKNYLNFVKLGNFSKAVSAALSEAENKNEELKREVESLEYQQENTFKAPPKEWINYRLERLGETLNKDTVLSALALKELLSPIILEPVLNKEADLYQLFDGEEKHFKPYYIAHTKIQTLALLDERYQSSGRVPCGDSPCGAKGSNWYGWRWFYDTVRTIFV